MSDVARPGPDQPDSERPNPRQPDSERPEPERLGELTTEAVRPELAELDLLDTPNLVAVMAGDARRATAAVEGARAAIGRAVDVVVERLAAGGRLVYVGAGTAGRLAVLDAAELGPTFNVPPGVVEAVLAGGDAAMRLASEGAEDDSAAGAAALDRLAVSERDAVLGVSASGRTPFVLGALERARAAGAVTIGLACNAGSPLAAKADVAVELVVGGEVVAGSSRLNAGTAQKIALNTISTATMVRLGKTYGNLMVDVRPTNEKLRDRAVRIVRAVTGADAERASAALAVSGWDVKLACLIAASTASAAAALAALDSAGGHLRKALVLLREPARLGDSGPDEGDAGATGRSGGRHAGTRRLGVGAALIDGRLVPGDVAVEDGLVTAVGLSGGGSGIAVPGLVDLQVNGYAGIDVASAAPDELEEMARVLARDGVLAFQPTLISGDPDATIAAAGRVAAALLAQRGRAPAERGAAILGLHLEGPFLAPARAGTHPPERLVAPDAMLADRLCGAGPVTMVTLAPELAGAPALVEHLVRRGVVVALGHSEAEAADVDAAVAAGATAVTHLFNAMAPMSSRRPGLAGRALGERRLALQLIADGGHVADELLTLAFAAAPGRCSIVTDATSLAGAGDGKLTLGEVPIAVAGGVARRPDGTIAGGASSLLQGVRRLAALPIALEDALAAVTERPAGIVRAPGVGGLHVGGPADLLVLSDDLDLVLVLVAGYELVAR